LLKGIEDLGHNYGYKAVARTLVAVVDVDRPPEVVPGVKVTEFVLESVIEDVPEVTLSHS